MPLPPDLQRLLTVAGHMAAICVPLQAGYSLIRDADRMRAEVLAIAEDDHDRKSRWATTKRSTNMSR
jgi:hypothetical protein